MSTNKKDDAQTSGSPTVNLHKEPLWCLHLSNINISRYLKCSLALDAAQLAVSAHSRFDAELTCLYIGPAFSFLFNSQTLEW